MLPFILVPIGVLLYCLLLHYCITNAAIEEESICVDESGVPTRKTFIRTHKKVAK